MHLDNLEIYLNETNKSVEHKKKMEDVELVCQVEFKGSTILKDLHILVIRVV